MEISDFKEGDLAYVLNGRQNNALRAKVTKVDDEGIEVYVEAKQETQWYWKTTGTADVEPEEDEVNPRAILVTPEDWRVGIITQRKLFKEHTARAQKAATAFSRDPSKENAATLLDVNRAWTSFAQNADPFAIRAESIEDYKLITKQI